jgi:hypothetical protein
MGHMHGSGNHKGDNCFMFFINLEYKDASISKHTAKVVFVPRVGEIFLTPKGSFVVCEVIHDMPEGDGDCTVTVRLAKEK